MSRTRTKAGRISRAVTRFMPAVLLLAVVSGCGRRAEIRGAPADTTHAAAPDSAARRLRDAQARWDVPSGGEEASRLTATALALDLGARPASAWEGRARVLLDSLAIGSETAAASGALAVNFFSRADPEAGSWPFLFWSDGNKLRHQALEGTGLHLGAMILRGHGTGPASVAILFGRRAGSGQQPLVMVWGHARPGDPWSLSQMLGPDSLGGVGAVEFQSANDTTVDIIARTYTAARGFVECAMCPHVFRTRRFHWGEASFAKVDEQPVPSPYATFVDFVQALTSGDMNAAGRLVSDGSLVGRARKLEWDRARGPWRVAPETDETAHEMVFFRGKDEAWRVTFAAHGTDWVIGGFEPTTRSIE